eukprot:693440-Prymnesium_polylepis.1
MACVASAGRRGRPATCCACLQSFCWGCSMRSEGRRQKTRLRACCVRGGRYVPVRIRLVPLSSYAVVEVVSRGQYFLLSLSPATQPFPFVLDVSTVGAELLSSLRRTN